VRVLAPALPGFSGTSGLSSDECTLPGYARWLVSFLDELGVDDPVLLVGHSFGGGVAIRAAHDYPQRVGALVLVNSIGGAVWSRDGELDRPMTERPIWDWGLHFSRDLGSVGARLTRVLPVMLAEAVPNLVFDPKAFLRSARLARDADLTDELTTLHRRGLPVVVVWAPRDGVITEASFAALREALGDAPTITVTGGHNWLLADPDQFGEVITNVVEVADRARWLREGRARRRWRGVRQRIRTALRPLRAE
jgi:pimeloyl-ACP methyl ester carboxylesterase